MKKSFCFKLLLPAILIASANSAQADSITDVWQFVTNASLTLCVKTVDGERFTGNNCAETEFYPNLLIPTTDGVIRGNRRTPGYDYDHCSIVNFPVIEGYSRIYWVEGNHYGSNPSVEASKNIVPTDFFFNGSNERIEKTRTPLAEGGFHVRDCD